MFFQVKDDAPVSYAKKRAPKAKLMMVVKPEVYTEDHEKMLGDHIETRKLMVDGHDGERNHYAYEGKRCHQCRRKTAGIHSKCCKCETTQKLYCGSCLFKRYGENVLEASVNPHWVCPVCRDICNCSPCRREKGWEPVGNFYWKALHLGFKPVVHYLIHTHGPHGKQDDRDAETSEDLLDDNRGHKSDAGDAEDEDYLSEYD
ncbi:hypothetical protein L1987_74248 [Smallanthus sonchifolius]|uniref:Uncharacterized protein n=1 Tax=Smallanthus sonchifolius TaxID=185202 RepID=A0ACB9A1P6_9ASTR|nr:hypothetical protein L1987_74248 [Smallanthus sonchifolius]